MKKIIILTILLFMAIGCTPAKNDNHDNSINEDNSIWVINPYNPISYDEYYSQERKTELITSKNLVSKNNDLFCGYNRDSSGLFVYTKSNVSDSDYIDKQIIASGGKYYYYFPLLISDGYWFYYQSTDFGDTTNSKLVRVNYKGEEEIIIDNFNSNIYSDIYLIDRDVLVAVRNDEHNITLELIYLNGLVKQDIATELPSHSYIKLAAQSSSYHLGYYASNPEYISAYNNLMANDKELLNQYLKKYKYEFIEGKDEYNSRIITYIIFVEYGIYPFADFDYDIINKTSQYHPAFSEILVPDPYDPNK